MSFQKRGGSPIWRTRTAYLLVLPGLAFFLFFFLYPIAYSIRLSTTNANFFNFVSGYESIGLDNYRKLLVEGKFFSPLLRTFLFMLTSVSLKVLAGLFFASLLSSPYLKLQRVLRPFFLTPWAVPWFFLVLIWRGMFNQDFGVINQVLRSMSLPAVNWLNDARNAFFAYNVVETYLAYPFMMTVTLAAIQSIPPDLYESAIVDGASSWDTFRYITLPLIKRPFLWATLMTTIASYMIFGVPFLMNKGGPAGSNEFLLVHGYKRAFDLGRYGYAAAFMVLVFGILIILVVLFSKTSRLTEEA
ncbi:MAG: sugar ABC transporter permease [Chloroflexi bacterium]|nr:sugar ABC transporter permease [Chloroflexota bacterium]